MKRTVAVVAVVCTLAAPALAVAGAADDQLALGLARYEAGDFDGAMDAFDAGYAVDPRPAFLFAAAQAARRSGDCRRAIDYYDRFLASDPSERQAEAAREQRDRCAETLPAETAPAEPDPAPAAPVRRWYRDPVTDGVIVGSVVLLLAGTTFALSAADATDDANAATTYDEHDAAADRASRRQVLSLVTFGGGVALGAYAAWRIVRHPDGHERSATLRVGAGPGVGLAIGGAF
jgi:tetratricopeptide (TPR) repeat protein